MHTKVAGKVQIQKVEGDQMLAFGWASVAATTTGEAIEDLQHDVIDIDDLECAAYDFVEIYREGGEMHERGGCAVLIESIVFTREKRAALGIPEHALPDGWWIGFRVTDAAVWEKIKAGQYLMFSIEGEAVREQA